MSRLKKITYNSNILIDENVIDDIGWGCTIRSGQMLIVNLLSSICQNQNNRTEFLNLALNINCLSIENFIKIGKNNFNISIFQQWN